MPNSTATARRKPACSAQVQHFKVTNQLRELIEGHTRRLLYRGYSDDISDQVASLLGISPGLAEVVVNEYLRVLLLQTDRYRCGLANVTSLVNAVRAEIHEGVA